MTVPTTSWDETSPAGSQNISLGDNRIREMKVQLREIVGVDHKFESSGNDADNGKHNKVSLLEQANLGTGTEGEPILGAQTASGKAELVFTDEDDNDVQITSGGGMAVLGSSGWRTGDILLSSSTTTPSGWTDASTTYDNKFIRITDGTPLTTGGSDTHTHAAGSYAAPAHDHGGTTGSTAGTLGDVTGGGSDATATHTHTISQQAAATITGTSASSSNVPAYIEIRMYTKN